MNDVYAWVVGIDHYDQNDWSLVGPCANALAVVEWLLTVNVPAANVRLFLDSEDPAIDDAAGKLAQRGVSVGRRADHATIDTFWRRDLRQSPKNFSRLFVYWSGHGFADNEGDRVFVCRDYLHPDLDNRVFNSANVLRHLRGSAYQHLREQIFIADVCATHANVALSPDKKPPADFVKATHQGAFFATPEGEYAKGANGRGAFTETVLEVLAKLNAWPEQTQLDADLKIAFEAIDKAIFHVSTFLDEAHETRRVGRLSAAPGTVFRSIFDALTGVNVADEVYRRHFLRTVNDLGEPALAAAQGLTGMLRELASLRDADEGEAPHGLLQFLVRLQQEAALTDVVEQWLAANAQRQQNALATVRAKLVAEAATKILIVEVANDQREEVSGYELSVRTNTLVPLPGISFPRRSLNGWSEFEAALVADLETLRRDHGVADFEIQFLVNPP